MNPYKYILIAIFSLFTGCAYGPFIIEHKAGQLPKARIDLPEGSGKLKVRAKSKEVKFIWEKKI